MATKKWLMRALVVVGIIICAGIFCWNFFSGSSAGTTKSASADVRQAEMPPVTEAEAPRVVGHEARSVDDVDPRIQAVVVRNIPDVGSPTPEVSRLALARIANTGRDGAVVLAYMLRSGDSTIRKNATRALLLLRRGGHDIVRMLSGMCTDNMLPASVSIRAMEIITGPDETDEKVGVLWQERGRAEDPADYCEPVVRRTPSPVRTILPTRTVASAVELQMQKNAAAEAKDQREELEDKISYLQKKIWSEDSYRREMQGALDRNPGEDPNVRKEWRDKVRWSAEKISAMKRQIAEAQVKLTEFH